MKHFCGSENGRLVTVFWFSNSEQLEYPAWKANTKIAVFIIFPRADKVYPPWYSPILTAPAIKRMSVKPIPRDPGAVSRVGRKGATKVSNTGGKAPGYRLLSEHFQTVKWILALHWAQKCFVLLCPIGEQHHLNSFRVFVQDCFVSS